MSDLLFDVTTHNIKIVSNGKRIDFVSPNMEIGNNGFIQGYDICDISGTPVSKDAKGLIIENGGHTTICRTDNKVLCLDTEYGTTTKSFSVSCNSAAPLNLHDMFPSKKFGNLESVTRTFDMIFLGNANDATAGKANTIAFGSCDSRTPGDSISIDSKNFMTYKVAKPLAAAATSLSGNMAVGDSSGIVRLYSKPTEKGIIRAKTNLDQYATGETIVGVDISADSKWVIWNTKDCIYLSIVEYRDDKNELHLGFDKRMGNDKKQVMAIQLSAKEHLAIQKLGIDINFTPVKFDNHSHDGGIENVIVTTCGSLLISWKMRNLLTDYKQKRFTASKAKDRNAHIVQLDSRIMADKFGYGGNSMTLSSVSQNHNIYDTQL